MISHVTNKRNVVVQLLKSEEIARVQKSWTSQWILKR
jgi:hypothetical protein